MICRDNIIECLSLKCLKEDLILHFPKTNLKSRYKTLGKMIYNQYHIYNYILQVKYKINEMHVKLGTYMLLYIRPW